MRASVKGRGWLPLLMAAFSAGRPKESKPIGREHGVAVHGAVADDQVAEGVVAHVTLVGRPARVRVHAQHVERGPGVVVLDLVGAASVPAVLPLALDLLDVVRLGCHAGSHGRGRARPILLLLTDAQRALARARRGSSLPKPTLAGKVLEHEQGGQLVGRDGPAEQVALDLVAAVLRGGSPAPPCVSTPSATTSRPRPWAREMMPTTRADLPSRAVDPCGRTTCRS